jgi:hypothetical protein
VHNIAPTQLKQILRTTLLEDAALELDKVVADEHCEERCGRGDEGDIECRELQKVNARMHGHINQRNDEVYEGKQQAAGLRHALKWHAEERARRAQQGIQDVVTESACKSEPTENYNWNFVVKSRD